MITGAGETMNIFRQLRWKLTLSYTWVTVSAFLVVLLVLGGIFFTRIFVPQGVMTPELMIGILQENSNPIWSRILSQSPVDTELIGMLLKESNPTITSMDFLRIGSVEFSVRTVATFRALIIGADGTLYGKSDPNFPALAVIGSPFDPSQVEGLEAPYNAALAGDTDSSHLYTVYEPNKRFLLAFPIFNRANGSEDHVVGVTVLLVESLPTQGDIPLHILNIAGRGLVIFLLGTGIMGAIFGALFAHGLTTRFKRLSTTTDAWSEGDFSRFIDDTTGDEISQFAQRLNNMAKQLQSLLRRRQDMAVSEERNRLARDLHDSAKQQALAASFQLGTALTLYDRDPQEAKTHLVEADALVDAVRKELTNLVDELRPKPISDQDFSETLGEHAAEWSHRSGIKLKVNVEGSDKLSLETRETLFRIAQEALANIARHSSASRAEISLEYGTDIVTLSISDNGCGFDARAQHEGIGLKSMKERTEVSGGSFMLESVLGQGTKVVVTLPKTS
jgi:signal transduction histidine kinase